MNVMTIGKLSRVGIQILWVLVWFGTPSFSQGETQVYSSLDDSHAALVVGDLKGLIEGAVEVANLAAPGMGGMIPAQAGGFLGDPELAGFEPGAGVAAVAFPGNLVVLFAEVSGGQREAYKKSAETYGIHSDVVGDLMVLWQEEAGMETGKKVASEVQETLLSGQGRASIEAFLHIPKIVSTYKTQIDEGLETFPEMMKAGLAESASAPSEATGITNLLYAELLSVYNLVSQLDIFRLELTPNEEGVSLDLSFIPQPDTNFGRLLTEAKGGDAENLIRMIPEEGTVRFEASYDVKAFGDFALVEMDRVLDGLKMTEEEKTNLRKWVEDAMRIYGSGFAGAMFGESEQLFNGAMIYNVEDPMEALKLFREMNSSMESLGILDLYKKMGMEMKFEYKENFKEHKGIPIHRMEMVFNFKDLKEKGAEAFLKSFSNLTYDLAIVEGYLLYTMGDTAIEKVIDQVMAGGSDSSPPLVSKEEFGPDGSLYVDFGVEGYLRMIANVLKDLPEEAGSPQDFSSRMDAALAALEGAPPILKGLFADTEQATIKIRVPAGLIQKASQAVTGAMTPKEN